MKARLIYTTLLILTLCVSVLSAYNAPAPRTMQQAQVIKAGNCCNPVCLPGQPCPLE